MLFFHVLFRALQKNDKQAIANLLKEYTEKNFICRYIRFTEEDKIVFVEEYLKLAINGLSVGFFEENTRQLIGFMINCTFNDCKTFNAFVNLKKWESPLLQALFEFDSNLEDGTLEFLGSDNYLTLKLVYIKLKYQNMGILERGIRWFENKARENNFSAIIITSYTHRPVHVTYQLQGYFPLKRLYYKDYRDPYSGEVLFAGLPLLTHLYATQLVKILKRSKL